jgi:ribosomal-protein-alanine N-acetyltransferase
MTCWTRTRFFDLQRIRWYAMYGPVIEGSIFRLRPPRLEEAADMIGWLEDMEVTAGLHIRFPPSVEQEEEWLRGRATDRSAVMWVIEHEGRAVGTTAIEPIDWMNLSGSTGTLIGDKRVWGRGIAGEMMRRRAEFAFAELPLRKLRSGFLDGNEASRRAQLGAGYREVGRRRGELLRRGRWLDVVLTELLREDWEAQRGSWGLAEPAP